MKRVSIFIFFLLALGFASPSSLWAQDSWQEVNSANAPPPREGHTLAELNGAAYLFGGLDGVGTLRNDLWKFANDAWTEEIPDGAANSPSKRAFHSTAVSDGRMYIFFGIDESGTVLSDVWSFSSNDS